MRRESRNASQETLEWICDVATYFHVHRLAQVSYGTTDVRYRPLADIWPQFQLGRPGRRRKPSNFREADVRRAWRALSSAGLKVSAIRYLNE